MDSPKIMKTLTIALFLCCASFSSTYNLLAVFPHEGKSHEMIFAPIIEELVRRGHSLTTIIHHTLNIKSSEYKEIVLNSPYSSGLEVIEMKHLESSSVFYQQISSSEFVINEGLQSCDILLSDENVVKLMQSNQKFDLIIGELFNSECSLGFIHRFKAPIVAISTTSMIIWHNRRFGNPDNPAYVPHSLLWYGDKMNFIQRVVSVLSTVYTKLKYDSFLDTNKKLLEKHLNSSISNFDELIKNISLILVNTHWSMEFSRPLVPAVVQIGGVHIQKAKKLPQVRIKVHLYIVII